MAGILTMDQQQACPDCGGEMEVGFIPDVSVATAFQASWHPGEPGDKTPLDYIKYGPGVKYDRSQMIAVTAMRCKQCGLLKLYATTP